MRHFSSTMIEDDTSITRNLSISIKIGKYVGLIGLQYLDMGDVVVADAELWAGGVGKIEGQCRALRQPADNGGELLRRNSTEWVCFGSLSQDIFWSRTGVSGDERSMARNPASGNWRVRGGSRQAHSAQEGKQ
jgi:hypothetical protein